MAVARVDIVGVGTSFHGTILPAVFEVLSDANNEVQNTACFVLEGFCENMTPSDVLRYLDSLMANLGRLITSPNVNVREMAVGCSMYCGSVRWAVALRGLGARRSWARSIATLRSRKS